MKNLITTLIIFLASLSMIAQQGINYKAVIQDGSGNLLSGTFMNVQFTIHQNTSTGTIVYQEDHNYTTDANGMLILNIGSDSSPSVGVFNDIDWSSSSHFLQTTITYSGGTINFDATEFMAVPYAKHAETASNVFSGDYNDLINQPTISDPTGLELITQETDIPGEFNTGWRLQGVNQGFYGIIGDNAVDLSYSPISIPSTLGATGHWSFAVGYGSNASGNGSIAITGYATGNGSKTLGGTASGHGSTAIGGEASGIFSRSMNRQTYAESYFSTAMGRYNVGGGYAGNPEDLFDGANWVPTDPLFEIGNGTSNTNRNNALTILKNGDAQFDGEIRHTSTGSANMIPIAYGIVESNGNTLANTDNFTATVNSGVFTIDVNDTESLGYDNTVCVITPISSLARTSSTLITDGNNDGDSDIIVRIFNSSGVLSATTFQFVIYKL